MKNSLWPFLAMAATMDSELSPMTSTESITWYNSLNPEQQEEVKGETFELLTGQTYKSMNRLFSHEELVKIAYDKLKIEGFDV